SGGAVRAVRGVLDGMPTKEGRTGLLAKDLNEVQARMLALAQDRSRCDEMGRAAAAFVARSFSIEVRVSQIEELLLGQLEGSTVKHPVPVPQGRILPAEEMLAKNSDRIVA